jgi:hypothetical protein
MWWLSSISSLTIDLPLIMSLGAVPRRDGGEDGVGLLGVLAQCTCTPLFDELGLQRCSSSGRCDRLYWRMDSPTARNCSNRRGVAEVRRTLGLQEVHRAAKAAAQVRVVHRHLGVGLELARVDKLQRRFVRAGGGGVAFMALPCVLLAPRSLTSTMISSLGPCAP